MDSDVASDDGTPRIRDDFDSTYNVDWMRESLRSKPISHAHPDLTLESLSILSRWHARFDRRLWIRLCHKHRALKELNEVAPVISLVRRHIADTPLGPGEKFTIVDLCSGFGYLSMFLSELLPPARVRKIVLVDKSWPMYKATPRPHHINWEHIQTPGWPIELQTRKVDLKSTREVRQLGTHVVEKAVGPVIVLAVHLCGTLSIKAVTLFNIMPQISLLVLKPCCLPGKVHLRVKSVWDIGDHVFSAKDVHEAPQPESRKPYGVEQKFAVWSDHLHAGIKLNDVADKHLKTILVTPWTHQNTFIVAERNSTGQVPHDSQASADLSQLLEDLVQRHENACTPYIRRRAEQLEQAERARAARDEARLRHKEAKYGSRRRMYEAREAEDAARKIFEAAKGTERRAEAEEALRVAEEAAREMEELAKVWGAPCEPTPPREGGKKNPGKMLSRRVIQRDVILDG